MKPMIAFLLLCSVASAEVKFTTVDGETTGVAPALRDWKARSNYGWVCMKGDQ